jgi:hypothetical protein
MDVAYPSFLPPPLPVGSAPTRSTTGASFGSRLEAYRYRDLAPRGFDGRVTLYAVPRAKNRAVAHRELAAALGVAASPYDALGTAARSGNGRAHKAARGRITRLESRVERALDVLTAVVVVPR